MLDKLHILARTHELANYRRVPSHDLTVLIAHDRGCKTKLQRYALIVACSVHQHGKCAQRVGTGMLVKLALGMYIVAHAAKNALAQDDRGFRLP